MSIKISKNRLDMGSTPIKNVSYLDVDQVATQAAPATGKTRFYSKTDGALYVVPAAGSETAAGVPANVIAYTTDAAAPTGWAIYTALYGRFVVGFNTNIASTVGTALTTLENRTHTHTGPSHTHNQNTSGTGGSAGTNHVVNLDSAGAAFVIRDTSGASYPLAAGGVSAAGTGATGTAATGDAAPYIQLLPIQKS